MMPPKVKRDYEKVPTDNFVLAVVEDVEYDLEHKFVWQGVEKIEPGIRFSFTIENCKFPHRSRWMKFNVGEKSNLFKKFIQPLVEGAKPDMLFDLDLLKGMKIRMLWKDQENSDFQGIETVRPADKKVVPLNQPAASTPPVSDEVPF